MLEENLHFSDGPAPMSDLDELTINANADLLALRGSRFFITGGTGYIGRWILESLCFANSAMNLDIQATVLSRRPAHFVKNYPSLAENPAIRLLEGDVRNFVCADERFTHIIHAATDVVAASTPLDVFDVTVLGTRHVLDFARRHLIQNVLLLSSGAVYGTFPEGVDSAWEGLRCTANVIQPSGAYGLGKIATEWLGNTYGTEYGFVCKSARIFAQIGPGLDLGAQFAAGNFICDVLHGRAIIINGDGTSVRSYMYSTDLVAWLWAIMVRGRAGAAYNVGSDRSISIRELAELIVQVSNAKNKEIKVLGLPAIGVAPKRYVPDISFAQKDLGVSITVPLETALVRTLEWYRPRIKE